MSGLRHECCCWWNETFWSVTWAKLQQLQLLYPVSRAHNICNCWRPAAAHVICDIWLFNCEVMLSGSYWTSSRGNQNIFPFDLHLWISWLERHQNIICGFVELFSVCNRLNSYIGIFEQTSSDTFCCCTSWTLCSLENIPINNQHELDYGNCLHCLTHCCVFVFLFCRIVKRPVLSDLPLPSLVDVIDLSVWSVVDSIVRNHSLCQVITDNADEQLFVFAVSWTCLMALLYIIVQSTFSLKSHIEPMKIMQLSSVPGDLDHREPWSKWQLATLEFFLGCAAFLYSLVSRGELSLSCWKGETDESNNTILVSKSVLLKFFF